jgi:hypothetical protein
MAFQNTIAKYCFEKFERSLDVFPFDEGAIIEKFEDLRASVPGRKSLSKISKIAMDELIDFVSDQGAALFMSELDVASPLYGGKSQFIELVHLSSDNENAIKLKHTLIKRSKARVSAYSLLHANVVVSGHAIDRIYDRHSMPDIRTDPRLFAVCAKNLLTSLGIALEAKHFGISFEVPVPGGSFICERCAEGIIVKTFLGDRDWTEAQSRSLLARNLGNVGQLIEESEGMKDRMYDRTKIKVGCQKVRVMGSHMWLPAYDGLDLVH